MPSGIFSNALSGMVVTMLTTGRSEIVQLTKSLLCGNALVVIDLELSCRFSVAQFFFLHGFHNQFLEFRRVLFVRYSLWH